MEQLENLVRTKLLKPEPHDEAEFQGMIESARRRLKDIDVEGISRDGRFLFAYNASHTLALAALRWHGYRSTNRAIVFQCLPHTVNFSAADWRVLSKCHDRRNIAEYQGELEIEDALMEALIETTKKLLTAVEAMGVKK
jgi:hypothetical protein